MTPDYIAVFRALPLPATLVDAGGTIVDVNEAFLELAARHGIDLRREDRVGRPIWEIAGEEDPYLGRAAMRSCLAGNDPPPERRLERDPGGAAGMHELRVAVLRDGHGRVTGAVVTRDEVTETVRQSEQLEETSRLLNAVRTVGHLVLSSLDLDVVLDTMSREIVRAGVFNSLLVALVDHEARVVEVRRTFAGADEAVPALDGDVGRRIGFDEPDPVARAATSGELVVVEGHDLDGCAAGGRVSYYLPVKKADRILAVVGTSSPEDQRHEILDRIDIMRPLLDQVAIAIEHARLYRQTQRTGQEAQVRLAVQRVRNEVLLMERDSDWSKVLQALRRELRSLVRYNGCGINLIHRDGVVSYSTGLGVSATYDDPELPPPLALALKTERPVYRRSVEEMKAGGDRDNLVEAGIQSVVDVPFGTGTLAMNSLEPHAFDDTDVDVLVQFAAVVAEGHRRLEDLRALAAKERQLQQAQKMEAVGQLTAGIAHNFNNMLQAITGNLDLARAEARGDVARLIVNALESSGRAAEMVQQLMVYSRQGRRLDHRQVDVARVVHDVEAICQRTFDRRIRIEVHVDEAPPVQGDSLQLEQVVLNLCINARDALEESAVDEPLIALSCDAGQVDADRLPDGLSPGRFVRLQVRDNGPGMDEDTRKRIFEPFFTTKDVDKGTGLGLSTALGIVQDHGGWIECDSQPGGGAVFDMFLPEAVAVPAILEPPVVDSDPGGTETVLVIDDEEMVRSTAVQLLSRRGYRTLSAADGEEGLTRFRQRRDDIDLILLDHSMPRMSGKQVLSRLRAESDRVAIVIITGYPASVDEFEGADDLIQKPFSMQSLAGCVRRTLDSRADR